MQMYVRDYVAFENIRPPFLYHMFPFSLANNRHNGSKARLKGARVRLTRLRRVTADECRRNEMLPNQILLHKVLIVDTIQEHRIQMFKQSTTDKCKQDTLAADGHS